MMHGEQTPEKPLFKPCGGGSVSRSCWKMICVVCNEGFVDDNNVPHVWTSPVYGGYVVN